jgi:flavin reductase (DIM6/NTAB) family NADH-FMN oxidoreductase RutF
VRAYDKLKEIGLTPPPGKLVKVPLIKECVDHLECKLRSKCLTGDHTIFVGEIVEAHVKKGAFTDSYDLKKAKIIFHLGGDKYSTLE